MLYLLYVLYMCVMLCIRYVMSCNIIYDVISCYMVYNMTYIKHNMYITLHIM